jgi:hypothetical protein
VTTLTVTATQGGGTFQGMLLRVKVLTGAAIAASQTGGTVVTSTTYGASLTTTVTGSVVYGALTAGSGGFTAEPLCTLIDNYNDGTNFEQYGSFRTTSATGTPGSTLVGASAPAYTLGGMAAAEILPSGTIAEDASAPAVVTSNTLTALTTASFTPPAGSLIVVMIGSDGDGASTTTMTVTDTGGGLTWIPLAQANAGNQEYAGVWIAQVPAAGPATPPTPPARIPQLPPGWFPGSAAVTQDPGGIPFYPEPPPADATPAIQFPPTPEAAPYRGPRLPPGWVPGLAAVTQDPGGIPFYSEPQPENAPPAIPGLPVAPGIPDYMPYPPFWFPGGDKLSGAPGGIPFWVQPQPDSSPALPPSVAPPVITGSSADGTYFIDQYGSPRLLVGEDIWDIIVNGGRWNGNFNADIGAYTASRAAQGYTAAQVEMFSTNVPNSTYVFDDGRDWDGTWPFAGSTDPTTTPNPAFWARRDYFLSSCAANGITVVFSASTAGLSVAGNWILGWSTAQWQAYGTFLANRYKNTPNILWITGDDYFGEKDTQLSAWLAALRAAGDTHLVAIQGYQETTSRFAYNPTHSADPLSFCVNSQYDWVYTYNPSYNGVTYAQQFEPSGSDVVQAPVPPVWGDGFYLASGTGSGQTDVRLERQNIWWALASGAAGFSTGDNEVYPWLATAPALVTSKTFYSGVIPAITGAFRNLPGWQKLVSDWNSVLVTAGRGTRATDVATGSNGYIDNTDNYVAASFAADGTLAVIYCAQAFSITIDQAKMAPGYTVTWIDPVNGAQTAGTPGSTYNSGTAKGSNSAGDPDWVLVLQGTPASGKAPGRARQIQPVLRRLPGLATFT